jgi:UDP-glucose 4-epimerase
MTVLVTGGAGYIGSHMIHELLDAGERVVVLDNLSTGHRWAVPEGVTFYHGSTADTGLTRAILEAHEVRAIIHFAASLIVPESVSDPLGYYLNNTVATRALLESAVKTGVKQFIFSSTAAVYGNVAGDPVTEDVPTLPMSPYGMSKLMSEAMLRDVSKAHGLQYAVLRYFNVAGADPRGRTGMSTPNATLLIKVAVETVMGKRPFMKVFGTDYPTRDGTCIRDYIHVSDLARAHSDALRHLRAGGESGTFNCGYGRGFSVLEVIDTVRQVAGKDFDVRITERRPGDPAQIVANADRIRHVMGWKPVRDDLKMIVSDALAWEEHLSRRNTAS